MFQVDRSINRLRKLERTSFSEVGFREREHLQEWLATMRLYRSTMKVVLPA